jgi:mxaJ protein
MFSLCHSGGCALALVFASIAAFSQMPVRVCADPDNLPFSNAAARGFDNRIAELLAHDLNRPVVFVWARARRGFLREQFNKGACDVLMGTPRGLNHVRTTIPYYISSYVFVTRRDEHLYISRFDDPAIGRRRIGLQILEEDFSPPSLPLIRLGHAAQLVGFDSFGQGGEDIVRAVVDKRVGLSVVWGPLAGYYAAKQPVPLSLSVVEPSVDSSGVPFSFAITMAVHNNDTVLADELNTAIHRNHGKIRSILAAYHVPLRDEDGGGL